MTALAALKFMEDFERRFGTRARIMYLPAIDNTPAWPTTVAWEGPDGDVYLLGPRRERNMDGLPQWAAPPWCRSIFLNAAADQIHGAVSGLIDGRSAIAHAELLRKYKHYGAQADVVDELTRMGVTMVATGPTIFIGPLTVIGRSLKRGTP